MVDEPAFDRAWFQADAFQVGGGMAVITVVSWPSYLRHCPLLPLQEAVDKATIDFPVSAGPPKRRRTISDAGTIIQASWLFTQAERDLMLEFWRYDLGSGSNMLTFDTDPFGHQGARYICDEPQFTRIASGHHQMTMTLRRLPG